MYLPSAIFSLPLLKQEHKEQMALRFEVVGLFEVRFVLLDTWDFVISSCLKPFSVRKTIDYSLVDFQWLMAEIIR